MKKLLPLLFLLGLTVAADAQAVSDAVPAHPPGSSALPSNKPVPVDPFVAADHEGTGRLGMRIGFLPVTGLPYIVAITQGGPAMDYGFRVGDVIIRIGKNDPLSLTPEQVKLSLHGVPGSSIELTIQRNDEPHPRAIAVQRRELPPDALDSQTPYYTEQYYRPVISEVPYGNY